MTAALAIEILRFIVDVLGTDLVRKHLNEWEVARAEADRLEKEKFPNG